MNKSIACEKICIYSEGTQNRIEDPHAVQDLIEQATRLVAQADNIYWKPISEGDIHGFRNGTCIEIIFAEPQRIVIQAIKEEKTISKILIPLHDAMCADDMHILYGDPEYETFNLLLNSEGCGGLRALSKIYLRR